MGLLSLRERGPFSCLDVLGLADYSKNRTEGACLRRPWHFFSPPFAQHWSRLRVSLSYPAAIRLDAKTLGRRECDEQPWILSRLRCKDRL